MKKTLALVILLILAAVVLCGCSAKKGNCTACGGDGMLPCMYCSGNGRLIYLNMVSECPMCRGGGEAKCGYCWGTGNVP